MPGKHFWTARRLLSIIGVVAVIAGSLYYMRTASPATISGVTDDRSALDAPVVPKRPRPEPAPGPANFLHTSGNKILDAQGNEVQLTGVNWFGLETGTFAPHGLWERNYEDMLDQIVDLGYNSIRLPFSNQLFEPLSLPEGVDYRLNPDLRGLTGLQVMDKIIEGAGRRGIKIILDRHRPDIEKQTTLWYNERISEDRWIADWKMLAERYKGNDTVVGADLHNEPHTDATWGTGNPKTDWRMAAEKAGNAILSVNSDWLIIVEGIETYNGDWYWWGGNLQGVAKAPVKLDVPNRLVYSAHDYGPGVWMQGWFKDPTYPKNLPAIWLKQWAYIHEQGIAPVLMGEFGGRLSDTESLEGKWQHALVSFLKENGMSYSYWAFNSNSGDTGGILDELDETWSSIDESKQAMLASYQAPRLVTGQFAQINLAATPKYDTETASRAKLNGDLRLLYHTNDVYRPGDPLLPGAPGAQVPMLQPAIRLLNVGPAPMPLKGLELRYWFAGKSDALEQATVKWSTVGKKSVNAEVVKAGGQDAYLKLTFASDAGNVLGKGGVIDIQAQVANADGSPFAQTADFSFDHKRDAEHLKEFRPNERIGLYSEGKLIWGTEPGAN